MSPQERKRRRVRSQRSYLAANRARIRAECECLSEDAVRRHARAEWQRLPDDEKLAWQRDAPPRAVRDARTGRFARRAVRRLSSTPSDPPLPPPFQEPPAPPTAVGKTRFQHSTAWLDGLNKVTRSRKRKSLWLAVDKVAPDTDSRVALLRQSLGDEQIGALKRLLQEPVLPLLLNACLGRLLPVAALACRLPSVAYCVLSIACCVFRSVAVIAGCPLPVAYCVLAMVDYRHCLLPLPVGIACCLPSAAFVCCLTSAIQSRRRTQPRASWTTPGLHGASLVGCWSAAYWNSLAFAMLRPCTASRGRLGVSGWMRVICNPIWTSICHAKPGAGPLAWTPPPCP